MGKCGAREPWDWVRAGQGWCSGEWSEGPREQSPRAREKQPLGQRRLGAGREAAWYGLSGCFLGEDRVCPLAGRFGGRGRPQSWWPFSTAGWDGPHLVGRQELREDARQPLAGARTTGRAPGRQGCPLPPPSEPRLPLCPARTCPGRATGVGVGGSKRGRLLLRPARGGGRHGQPHVTSVAGPPAVLPKARREPGPGDGPLSQASEWGRNGRSRQGLLGSRGHPAVAGLLRLSTSCRHLPGRSSSEPRSRAHTHLPPVLLIRPAPWHLPRASWADGGVTGRSSRRGKGHITGQAVAKHVGCTVYSKFSLELRGSLFKKRVFP